MKKERREYIIGHVFEHSNGQTTDMTSFANYISKDAGIIDLMYRHEAMVPKFDVIDTTVVNNIVLQHGSLEQKRNIVEKQFLHPLPYESVKGQSDTFVFIKNEQMDALTGIYKDMLLESSPEFAKLKPEQADAMLKFYMHANRERELFYGSQQIRTMYNKTGQYLTGSQAGAILGSRFAQIPETTLNASAAVTTVMNHIKRDRLEVRKGQTLLFDREDLNTVSDEKLVELYQAFRDTPQFVEGISQDGHIAVRLSHLTINPERRAVISADRVPTIDELADIMSMGAEPEVVEAVVNETITDTQASSQDRITPRVTRVEVSPMMRNLSNSPSLTPTLKTHISTPGYALGLPVDLNETLIADTTFDVVWQSREKHGLPLTVGGLYFDTDKTMLPQTGMTSRRPDGELKHREPSVHPSNLIVTEGELKHRGPSIHPSNLVDGSRGFVVNSVPTKEEMRLLRDPDLLKALSPDYDSLDVFDSWSQLSL